MPDTGPDQPTLPDPEAYRFRGLHPPVPLGTASDRYSGWLGQIYTPERYRGRIARRVRRLGGRSFVEAVLPVESVREYFEHFEVLEIDFTFYRPLLDPEGRPTSSLHALREYARNMKPEDRLILKAPREFFARRIPRDGRMEVNPSYLDAGGFGRRFYDPVRAVLGDRLGGIVFEQEYQRAAGRTPPAELACELDRFFRALPGDTIYHVELRTPAYLARPVLDALETRGVGLVFSHWTWLPPLREQFRRAGRRFTNRGGRCLIRLMTPREIRYEDAYARAYPFDRLVEGMMSPDMIGDVVEIVREAAARGIHADVVVNNRAGGNAPEIARLIGRALAR